MMRFIKYTIFELTNYGIIIFIFIFLTPALSCRHRSGTTKQLLLKDSFNIKQLRSLIDSLPPALRINDTAKIEKIISQFNNRELAFLHPDLVFHAYYMAYSGSQDFERTNLKEYEKKLGNFYSRFSDLAKKYNNDAMLCYAEYIKGRNLNELHKNELALPLLLYSLEKFKSRNLGYGYAVAAKRIGAVYFDSYQDYNNATKYFKMALPDTFDLNNQGKCYTWIIRCYFFLENYDSLSKYVNEFIKKPIFDSGYFTDLTWAHLHIFKYAHNINGNLDSAEKYFNSLLKGYTENPVPGDYSEFMGYCPIYCNALLKKKEFKILERIVNVITGFEKKHPEYIGRADGFYEICYKYYETKGNLDLSNFYLKRYVEVNKKLAFESQKRRVELARVDYEVGKQKLAQIIIQQQNEITARQKFQKEKLIRNSLIGGTILLIILIFVLINRAKLKRTIEMERMRSRLSRDLHDDIGSTLSSINILSRTAQTNLTQTQDEKTRASLQKINERSQRLLDNMSDIIWNINPGNDTIEEVMSRMREYATTLLEAKNIDYTFNFPKEIMACKLTMEVKNNMYLIFKEAVNNLSKYSGCTHANLWLTFDETNIHLTIEDNGIGFNEQEIKHRGGLVNMQQRAAEIKGTIQINTATGCGTHIELTMPRYC
jgi:signal transduction histidine kinase